MRTLFPKAISDKNNVDKFWDHLYIMSGFKLDVDFPCEVIDEASVRPKAEKIPYNNHRIYFRHYGRNIENMINVISDMEAGDEKDALIFMVANQMKKLLLANSSDDAIDARVINDLNFYSGGRLALDPETYRLCEFKDVDDNKNQKKKKKK